MMLVSSCVINKQVFSFFSSSLVIFQFYFLFFNNTGSVGILQGHLPSTNTPISPHAQSETSNAPTTNGKPNYLHDILTYLTYRAIAAISIAITSATTTVTTITKVPDCCPNNIICTDDFSLQ